LIPEAQFKEFETRLKYSWFQLKLYSLCFKILAGAKLKRSPSWNEHATKKMEVHLKLRLQSPKVNLRIKLYKQQS